MEFKFFVKQLYYNELKRKKIELDDEKKGFNPYLISQIKLKKLSNINKSGNVLNSKVH